MERKKEKKEGRKRGEWDPLGDISGLLSSEGSFTPSIIHRLMKSGKLASELSQSLFCPTAPFLPFPSPLQNTFLLCCQWSAHLFHTSLRFLSAFMHACVRARCVRACPTPHKISLPNPREWNKCSQLHRCPNIKQHILHTDTSNGSDDKSESERWGDVTFEPGDAWLWQILERVKGMIQWLSVCDTNS